MSAQLDMFPTELSAAPNTDSDLVGVAVRRADGSLTDMTNLTRAKEALSWS